MIMKKTVPQKTYFRVKKFIFIDSFWSKKLGNRMNFINFIVQPVQS